MIALDTFLDPSGNVDNAPLMAALLADMAANPGETYTAKRGQVFRINGSGYVIPAGVRLRLEGAQFYAGASIPAGAFMTFGEDADIDRIGVRILSGCTVADNVLDFGARLRADEIALRSDDQQANAFTNVSGGVRLSGSESDVGFIDVAYIDKAIVVWGNAQVSPNINSILRRANVVSFQRGLLARNCDTLIVTNITTKVRSPNASGEPGNNAILVSGAANSRFSGGVLCDAGEHGFRAGSARDLLAGAPHAVNQIAMIASDFVIRDAGQCGFKVWGGDVGTNKDVTLANITVIDCGDGGNGYGFNDEGFLLQGINGLSGSNLTVSRRDREFSSKDCFYFYGIKNGRLNGLTAVGAQRNGIRLSEFSNDTSEAPWSMNTLHIASPLIDSNLAEGVFVNFPGSDENAVVRDVMISDAQIIGGTDGIGSNAAASKFRQPCYFSAFGRGQTGSLFALPATPKIKAVAL